MKAPEKIIIGKSNITSDGDVVFAWVTTESDCEAMQHNVEYIRTDVFMEKAEEYLRNEFVDMWLRYIRGHSVDDEIKMFKNYMQDESI